jgi:hypothetical protein
MRRTDGTLSEAQRHRNPVALVGLQRGARGGQTTLSAGFPPPRKKFPDAVDRMIGNTRQHISQVSLWIDVKHFAGLQDREHCGGAIAPGVGAQEDKIFTTMEIYA